MDGIIFVLPVLGPQHHANPDLGVVRGTAHFHHSHRDVGLFGREHALLVRLDLRSGDHGRRQIVAVTGQFQWRGTAGGLRLRSMSAPSPSVIASSPPNGRFVAQSALFISSPFVHEPPRYPGPIGSKSTGYVPQHESARKRRATQACPVQKSGLDACGMATLNPTKSWLLFSEQTTSSSVRCCVRRQRCRPR